MDKQLVRPNDILEREVYMRQKSGMARETATISFSIFSWPDGLLPIIEDKKP